MEDPSLSVTGSVLTLKVPLLDVAEELMERVLGVSAFGVNDYILIMTRLQALVSFGRLLRDINSLKMAETNQGQPRYRRPTRAPPQELQCLHYVIVI